MMTKRYRLTAIRDDKKLATLMVKATDRDVVIAMLNAVHDFFNEREEGFVSVEMEELKSSSKGKKL